MNQRTPWGQGPRCTSIDSRLRLCCGVGFLLRQLHFLRMFRHHPRPRLCSCLLCSLSRSESALSSTSRIAFALTSSAASRASTIACRAARFRASAATREPLSDAHTRFVATPLILSGLCGGSASNRRPVRRQESAQSKQTSASNADTSLDHRPDRVPSALLDGRPPHQEILRNLRNEPGRQRNQQSAAAAGSSQHARTSHGTVGHVS